MASTMTTNQRLVAAGGVAPQMFWSDATAPAGNHHSSVIIPAPADYRVKPVFAGTSRRPSEGST